MEGIADGQAVDSCFFCALIHPELEDCPRCGKRLHYQPARMRASDEVDERWKDLLKQFQAEPSAANSQALLELVHQHLEELEDRLGVSGAPSLADLGRAFEAEGTPAQTQSSSE